MRRSNSEVVSRLGSRRTSPIFYDSGMHPTATRPQGPATAADVAAYWNTRIHDLEMTTHPVGTREFFDDLDDYRFDKLHYLPRLVDFNGFAGKRLLEIGCGIGTDLVRFAQGRRARHRRRPGGDLDRPGAAELRPARPRGRGRCGWPTAQPCRSTRRPSTSSTAMGCCSTPPTPPAVVAEARRVLRPGGVAIFMVYNRVSWLHAMSKVMRVGLEHGDAPVLQLYSIPEFTALLAPFRDVRDRARAISRRIEAAQGMESARLTTRCSSAPSTRLPKAWVRRYGWHLMAFCRPSLTASGRPSGVARGWRSPAVAGGRLSRRGGASGAPTAATARHRRCRGVATGGLVRSPRQRPRLRPPPARCHRWRGLRSRWPPAPWSSSRTWLAARRSSRSTSRPARCDS